VATAVKARTQAKWGGEGDLGGSLQEDRPDNFFQNALRQKDPRPPGSHAPGPALQGKRAEKKKNVRGKGWARVERLSGAARGPRKREKSTKGSPPCSQRAPHHQHPKNVIGSPKRGRDLSKQIYNRKNGRSRTRGASWEHARNEHGNVWGWVRFRKPSHTLQRPAKNPPKKKRGNLL